MMSMLMDAEPMSLQTSGINPNDFITIPDRYKSKYKSKTFGVNMTEPESTKSQPVVTVISSTDDTTITDTEYQPVKLEPINKTMIDAVEINE